MSRFSSGGTGTTTPSLSYKQLMQLWVGAGGSATLAPIMAAIAMAESGGNPSAIGAGADGLWQIQMPENAGYVPGGQKNAFNPQDNAKAAVAIYKAQGLNAWTTYQTGAYLPFLQSGAKVPVAALITGGKAFVDEAEKFLGVPYVWGGESPKGFDCSGLVQYVAQKLGLKNMPRTSEEQWNYVKHIAQKDLQPGDLVFLNFPGEVSPGHVMIWAGNNTVIQAPAPGQDVQKTAFDPSTTPAQWGATLVGFGRIPGVGDASVAGSSSSGSGSGSGGGVSLGGWLNSLDNALGNEIAAIPVFGPVLSLINSATSSSTSDVATAIEGVAHTFLVAEEAISWFFHPNHWIRIFAGIGGGAFVLLGVVTMARTGRGYSVNMPVAGQVPAPGGEIAPAMGIAEVTIGAVLLFIAFHNLPDSVSTLPDLLSYLQGQWQNKGAAGA